MQNEAGPHCVIFLVYYHHLPDGKCTCIHTDTQMHTRAVINTVCTQTHIFVLNSILGPHTGCTSFTCIPYTNLNTKYII